MKDCLHYYQTFISHPSSFIQKIIPELFFPFGSLLTVLGLLTGTATAMGTGDIGFLLCLRPHLVLSVILALVATTTASPDDAALNDGVDIRTLAHDRR